MNHKQSLNEIIRSFPNTVVTRNVHYYLKKALTEMEAIEKKEQVVTPQHQWNHQMQQSASAAMNPLESLRLIDQMIKEEQDKIALLKTKKLPPLTDTGMITD